MIHIRNLRSTGRLPRPGGEAPAPVVPQTRRAGHTRGMHAAATVAAAMAAVIAIALIAPAAALPGGLTQDPSYLAASQAAQHGDYAAALRLAHDLERRFGDDPRTYFLIGMLQDRAGDRAGAERTLATMRARSPKEPWAAKLAGALAETRAGTGSVTGSGAGPGPGSKAGPEPHLPGANTQRESSHPFEELHWKIRVDSTRAGPRIGEIRVDEGPAPRTAGGPFHLLLIGPVPSPRIEFGLGPGPVIVSERPGPRGRMTARAIPVDGAQTWIALPMTPGQSAIALQGPASEPLDRRPITPSDLWRAMLALARPVPEVIPRALIVTPPPGPSPAATAASPAPAASPPEKSPTVAPIPSPGLLPANPSAPSDSRWLEKISHLDEIERGLESGGRPDTVTKLRSLAELYLCPDLGRFDDASIARIDPYVNRQIFLPPDLSTAPLREALKAWLGTGDLARIEAAWTPWRRQLADRPLWLEMSTITLCRLSRRVEGILAGRPRPDAAGRLLALEALLLMARYEPPGGR